MKKITKYFLIAILVCAFVMGSYAAEKDTIVYITRTGDRYHIETCTSLRQSKIEITLEQAVQRGFTPCAQCNPPLLDKEE